MDFNFTKASVLKEAARAIRVHNYIHNRAERNALLITEYLNFAADLIDGLANGDVVVVRHGQWIERQNEFGVGIMYECSVCHKMCEHYTHIHYNPSPYCMHCGAKMDMTDTNDDEGETIL